MEVVNVGLKERSYSIYIDRGLLTEAGKRLSNIIAGKKIAIITNPTVNKIYGSILKNSFKGADIKIHLTEIPDGEKYKTLETAVKIRSPT